MQLRKFAKSLEPNGIGKTINTEPRAKKICMEATAVLKKAAEAYFVDKAWNRKISGLRGSEQADQKPVDPDGCLVQALGLLTKNR